MAKKIFLGLKLKLLIIFNIAIILLQLPPYVFADGWTPDKPSHSTLYADTITSKTDASAVNIADLQGLFVTGDITTLGKVGIGTTAPGAKLEVYGASASNIELLKLNNNNGAGAGTAIRFEQGVGTTVGQIKNYVGGDGTWIFSMGPYQNTEALAIHAGNVGIGTTGPRVLLHVVKSGTEQAIIGEGGVNGLHIRGASGSGGTHYNWLIGEQVSVNKGFEITPSTAVGGTTFSTPALTILADTGNVGIGTTGPTQQLALGGTVGNFGMSSADASDTGNLQISGGGTAGTNRGSYINLYGNEHASAGKMQFFSGIGTGSGNNIEFYTDQSGGATAKMVILPGGNVGIGTTAPGMTLHVRAADGSSRARFSTTLTANQAEFGLHAAAANYGAGVWVDGIANGLFTLRGLSLGTYAVSTVPPANGLIVSGNVGIGSTNPGSKATISGGDVYVSTSGNGIILKDTVDGTCRRVVLSSGSLSLSGAIACPSS